MVKQEKFKRLAGFLNTVVRVFMWATVAVAVICTVGSVIIAFLPAELFAMNSTQSLLLTIDGVIRYRLNNAAVSTVSFKPVLTTILVSSIAGFALLAFIFRNLAGILKTVKQDKPFAPENAGRLTNIGVILLLGSVVVNAIQAAVVYVMILTLKIQNIDINYSLNMTMLFTGLLLLILAGVFRYGSCLQDEVDSTL